MKPQSRSALIKGRILASVITFILLVVFLIIVSQMGLFDVDDNNEKQKQGLAGSKCFLEAVYSR